jgi:hypothetical protein
MTPKQTALSRLARLALNAVSASPVAERVNAYTLVAAALHDDCPDLSGLAANAAHNLSVAAESESDLFQQLTP